MKNICSDKFKKLYFDFKNETLEINKDSSQTISLTVLYKL